VLGGGNFDDLVKGKAELSRLDNLGKTKLVGRPIDAAATLAGWRDQAPASIDA